MISDILYSVTDNRSIGNHMIVVVAISKKNVVENRSRRFAESI